MCNIEHDFDINEMISGNSSSDVHESAVSFGINPISLQIAAGASELSEFFGDNVVGDLFEKLSNSLSGANEPGMEIIKDSVNKISDFYGVDIVKVFYEKNNPGLHFEGYTKSSYDNWIGGDPEKLAQYAQIYGKDFIENIIAHEFGHDMYSRLGGDLNSRIGNEAFADYAAGLYAGSRNLEPDGMSAFLTDHPGDGKLYPENRSELFLEGYNDAQSYTWREFKDIVDDPGFSLEDKMHEIAERYSGGQSDAYCTEPAFTNVDGDRTCVSAGADYAYRRFDTEGESDDGLTHDSKSFSDNPHSSLLGGQNSHTVSFGGKRDDLQREIRNQQEKIEYNAKQIARINKDIADGWIGQETSLWCYKNGLDSAQSKLNDLQRDLANLKE